MMDMALIGGTISSLRLAGDIAKSFLQLKTMAEVQGKVIELQSVILAAQSSALEANAAQMAMVEEMRTLKEEIVRHKAWETQKQRYVLDRPLRGTVAYALKESMSDGEPPHWICTNCYENGRKSILNGRNTALNMYSFECPVCKSAITTRDASGRMPEPKYGSG